MMQIWRSVGGGRRLFLLMLLGGAALAMCSCDSQGFKKEPAGESSPQRSSVSDTHLQQLFEAISSPQAAAFAALVNNLPEKLSGLILWAVPDPREGDAGVKRFLLSWSSDGKDWHALDLTDPNRTEFTANESQATATVRNLRESREDIVSALRENGVFIEHGQFVMRGRQILALDFDKAFQSFSIGALP